MKIVTLYGNASFILSLFNIFNMVLFFSRLY